MRPNEFNGLIGSIAGGMIKDRIGGPAGDIIGGLLSGGGGGGGYGGGGGNF